MINEIEQRFNRALKHCFSKLKFFSTFFTLYISSFILIFCNYISNQLDKRMGVSLVFISILVIFGILLSLGVFLIRVYYHEVKRLKVHFVKILQNSWQMIIKAFYVCIPMILFYLILWVFLSLFSLISKIPNIGPLFIFGPYLLMFLVLTLLFCNVMLLFFISPIIALSKSKKFISESIKRMKWNHFYNILSFVIALLPLALISGFLYISNVFTHLFEPSHIGSFFLMIRSLFVFAPICAIITPFMILFFNFAAEMYQLYKKL